MLYSLFSLYVPKFLERRDQLTSTLNTYRSALSATQSFIHTDATHHQEMGVGTAEARKGTRKGDCRREFHGCSFSKRYPSRLFAVRGHTRFISGDASNRVQFVVVSLRAAEQQMLPPLRRDCPTLANPMPTPKVSLLLRRL